MIIIYQILIDLFMLAGLMMIVALTQRKRHFILPLAVINLVIFSLTMVIYGQDLSIGSGLGLFAMFTLMRYRSKPLDPVEMSFLLVAICFGVLNAVYPNIFSIYIVLILESLILMILYIMLRFCAKTKLQKITYEKLELLKPDKHNLLIIDLERRFNRQIKDVTIDSINFSESVAILSVNVHLQKTIKNVLWKDDVIALTPHDEMGPVIRQSSSY